MFEKNQVSQIVSQTMACQVSASVWEGDVIYREANVEFEEAACISQSSPLLAPDSCG